MSAGLRKLAATILNAGNGTGTTARRARSMTPSRRSRTKSRTRGSSTGRPKKTGNLQNGKLKSALKTSVNGQFIKNTVRKLTPMFAKRDTLRKSVALAKEGYFATKKDVKFDPADALKEIEYLEKEINMTISMVRAGLGNRPIRMRLSTPFVITTTVTSGVTNTVNVAGTGNNRIDPFDATEFATLAALFTEYRDFGGEAVFQYFNGNRADTANNAQANNIPTMAYDVDSSASATGVSSLSQYAQHKMFSNTAINAATAAAATGAQWQQLHRFKFATPRGIALGSGVTDYPGTEWIVCSVPQAIGYLLFYHVGNIVTATDTGAGILFYDLEFRCRE